MKFSDINENLEEAPGDFGKRAKAKLQKNVGLTKQQRRLGQVKDKLFKNAKEIKNDLMAWKADSFENGEKEPLTMGQFLEWFKSYRSDLGATVEKVVRADKDYKDFFITKVDKDGEESQTGKDDKVSPRGSDQSEEEVRAAYKKQGDELEAKRKAQGGELVDEDSEEDSEAKVDMSASIYESRLRAFLYEDEDVGINPSKTLTDNQIDTIIVKALRAQSKSNPMRLPPESRKKDSAEDDDEIKQAADRVSNAKGSKKSDDEELTVSSPGRGKVSSNEISAIKDRLDEFGDDIKNIIRRQDGIEDSVKKELSNKIDSLVLDMIENSF